MKNLIAFLIILIAIVPFINTVLKNQSISDSPEITAQAVNTQLTGFLVKKEQSYELFLKTYDNETGFFKISGSESVLHSTYSILKSLKEISKLEQVPRELKAEVLRSTQKYYEINKNKETFSPSYLNSYYNILTLLGSNSLVNDNELLRLVYDFKVEGSGFTNLKGSNLLSIEETYHGLKILKSIDEDINLLEEDIINFINKKEDLNDEETYYLIKIGELTGIGSNVNTQTLLSCMVKQYIPLIENSYCSIILRKQNIFIYLPSLALLLIGYFLFIWK